MCGGGPKGPSEEDKKKAEQRHQENLALQKEQLEEQKRQFELTRKDNQARYIEQKKKAEAAPPPAPEKTAAVAAPALKLTKAGTGRKAYRTSSKPPKVEPRKREVSHAAKSLYIPN
tara:strand:- start:87 stop:434 length:348 start_codon:yes stop_codon:yes gene_type:complete